MDDVDADDSAVFGDSEGEEAYDMEGRMFGHSGGDRQWGRDVAMMGRLQIGMSCSEGAEEQECHETL